jgi:hypothetical protein
VFCIVCLPGLVDGICASGGVGRFGLGLTALANVVVNVHCDVLVGSKGCVPFETQSDLLG